MLIVNGGVLVKRVGMGVDAREHSRPTSSYWTQFSTAIPRWLHSVSVNSDPVQRRLSSQVGTKTDADGYLRRNENEM